MITKKYNLINNAGGWLVFVIALATYWLTLEPTASYWDCGEFIIQADKLEVGHPPGNPIFMLTARFFANFASDTTQIPLMVNAMSGLLSALTILLLFWTITHLVRRLVVKDSTEGELSLQQYAAIMGSGLVGALAYCWSDTFWFSAVEGEVYAFSSFCTALVFWLILKWENRADEPHSDRYLILIAYIIGVSVAVHLLNLLCIPAIVLVYAYRRYPDMNVKKSLLALLISFAIIVLVLYGLVPGFIKVAQWFELFFVNDMGMSFNSGAIAYAVAMAAAIVWSLIELSREKSAKMIRISVLLAVTLSGMLFIGNGLWIGIILTLALAALLFVPKFSSKLSVRMLNVAMWSIGVIFVGYSSYALILIRSSADTPMNQNSPDNVFDLASYLNREQYGENPLLYGETLNSSWMKRQVGVRRDTVQYSQDGVPIVLTTPEYESITEKGKPIYAKGVAGAEPVSADGFLSESEIAKNRQLASRGGDYYVKSDYKSEPKMNPELNMLLPRIYSRQHQSYYPTWVDLDTMPENMVDIMAIDAETGEKVPEFDTSKEPVYNEYTGSFSYPAKQAYKPTFLQNLAYFFNYQLNHMYLRYFMWNFAGRQNDINNQFGEVDAGNWISGIAPIDNARLGDQSLLPEDLDKGNKGHNVYYMLPLLLGIIGLLWQVYAGKRGVEQFWVVFFLFFMTGIAIVLYLNQPPNQPRERDYAFAGSFYAWAIWIGMGVSGLWRIILYLLTRKEGRKVPAEIKEQSEAMTEEPTGWSKQSKIAVAIACLIGIVVPVQMESQTWDDHDRSGRYAARDYAINYLESLEPNAIVFCNGDNDTFPLWYVQEVEGVRPDVRIINLSYLNSDWYANQMLMPAYDSAPVKLTAKPADYAYGKSDVTVVMPNETRVELLTALKDIYSGKSRMRQYPMINGSTVYIPVDKKAVMARGLVAPMDTSQIVDAIEINLPQTPGYRQKGYISLGELLMLDIIATNAAEGWPRPIYWASTVGEEQHVGLTPYLRSTGMAHQLVPTIQRDRDARTDRIYDVITKKYRWGGADKATAQKAPYFDETARRMYSTVRMTMVDAATQFLTEGDMKHDAGHIDPAKADYKKALDILNLSDKKTPTAQMPYSMSVAANLGQLYIELGDKDRLNDPKLIAKGRSILLESIRRFAPYANYHRYIKGLFGNPQFTLETQYAPYQLYHFIDLYQKSGGDMKDVDKILKLNHLSMDELKNNWGVINGDYSASQTSDNKLSEEELLAEMEDYAAVVNKLAALSPEEYAAASAQEKEIDTVFFELIDYYKKLGGTEESLMKGKEMQKVDMARSKRLHDASKK